MGQRIGFVQCCPTLEVDLRVGLGESEADIPRFDGWRNDFFWRGNALRFDGKVLHRKGTPVAQFRYGWLRTVSVNEYPADFEEELGVLAIGVTLRALIGMGQALGSGAPIPA